MKTPDEVKKSLDAHCRPFSCGECEYEKMIFCRDLLIKDAHALIQQLEAHVPKWIPVEERLPEKGVFVVVYYGNFIGNLMDVYMWDGECWRSSSGYLEDAENITHWMPLPEPPKEDD